MDLTEVSDHDGHFFIESVQNHDNDKADDGRSDGRGHLRGQILLDWVCLVDAFGKGSGKYNEHREPVNDDADN